MHIGVIAFVGTPIGASGDRGADLVLDVQLPVMQGDSYLSQTGKAPIETALLPMAVDQGGREHVMESFGRGMEQSTPNETPMKKALKQPSLQSGVASTVSETTLIDADVQIPARYHDEHDLDTPPRMLIALLTEFPDKATAANVQGSVTLAVYVDVNGVVDKVDVLRAEPAGYFEASAMNAVKAVRFSPGWKGGSAVNSRIELSINYGVIGNKSLSSKESAGPS